MRLTFLGTGGTYPRAQRAASSNLVSIGDRHLLVDVGRGATVRLVEAGIHLGTIDTVLLTHLHWDHIGDLADLILNRWVEDEARVGKPLTVVGPPGTEALIGALLGGVYGPDIRWRIAAEAHFLRAHGRDPSRAAGPAVHVIETLGDVPSGVGGPACTVTACETEHGRAFLDLPDWHSIAFRFEAVGRALVLTGDAAADPALTEFSREADVVVANVPCPDVGWVPADDDDVFRTYISSIFMRAGDVGRFATNAQVGTLVVTHMGRYSHPAPLAFERDIRQHWPGPLLFAHDLMTLEI